MLKLPRSGSTMLAAVLDAHPSVSCAAEALNPVTNARRADKVKALRQFYSSADVAGSGPAGRALGQTMNPFKYSLDAFDIATALGPAWARRAGRFGRRAAATRPIETRVLVLLRRNLLKQAISESLARTKRNWASSRHHVAHDHPLLDRQRLDVNEVVETVERLHSQSEQLRAIPSRLRAPTLEVLYEDLQHDPIPCVDRVFDFLAVDPPGPGFDYTAGFVKIHSDDLGDIVENYDEIAAHPRLARFLDHEAAPVTAAVGARPLT